MWQPWRQIRQQYPDWHVEFARLPDGVLGGSSVTDRVIWIDDRLGQTDRRWVVAHELVHIERGHDGPCAIKVECSVSAEAARRLIPIVALGDAVCWATTLSEVAAELWVPPHVVVTRMHHLHPAERTQLARKFSERDG